MKDKTAAQKTAMDSGLSLTPQVRATLEWNWNRYRSFAVVDNVRKDEDYNENYDIAPIDSIVQNDRPPSGIAKAMVGQAKLTGVYDDLTRKPRFYLAGPHDPYKYWLSPYKSSPVLRFSPVEETLLPVPRQKATAEHEISHCEPRIVYNEDVLTNKIVVCVEDSWAKPVDWQIQIGTGAYPHINWQTISDSPSLDSNGRVELYLENDGVTWGGGRNWNNSTPIRGVRVIVNSLNKRDSYFGLIEISARLEALYSDRLSAYNFNYTMSEPDLVSPVGIASANTGSVTLSNDDGYLYSQVLQKNVMAKVDSFVADGWVRMGQMFVSDWDESSDGMMTANLIDASRILQERKVPSLMFRDKTPMEIIWAICDAVGFNDVQHFRTTDDVSHTIPFWWTNGGQTAWQLIQDLARPHQLVVSFDEYNQMTVRSNRYMFNKARQVDGILRGATDGTSLANIVSYGRARNFQITDATVKWYRTHADSNPVVVWQPTQDIVLRSTQLSKAMTRNQMDFHIKQKDAVVWPYSGRVFIQGEIIEYDAKEYSYYDKHKQKNNVWVTSAAQKKKIDGSLTYPGWHWKSSFSGKFRITDRGYGPTGRIYHPVDIHYWQPASGAPGGTMKHNSKWMKQDKNDSTLDLHTPRSWTKDDLYWATRGSVDNLGFHSLGTRLLFKKGNKHGYAGIVFGIYGEDANNCYMVQVKTTKICTKEKRKYTNEISVLRKGPDGYTVLAPKPQSEYDKTKTKKVVETYKGEVANIAENVWHTIDVSVNGGKIGVYLDGAFQMSVMDPRKDLPDRGRVGLFVRGASSAKFEYFYAANGPGRETPDQSTFIDRINGGFSTIQYQHEFVYRERMTKRHGKRYRQKYGGTLFDEFGPIVHEARQFDFTVDAPILSGRIYTSNDQVVCTDETFRPFHTSFWLANASRENAVINGSDTLTYGTDNAINQVMVAYGRKVAVDDARTVRARAPGKARGIGDISLTIDSKWIQTKGQAEDLADWIRDNWSTQADELTVEVWADPFFQLGDRVTITYPGKGLRLNQDYFVIGITYGWDNGMTTQLVLRQVPAD